MNAEYKTAQDVNVPASAAERSLVSRLLDMLVVPGDVFDDVLAAPASLANWLIPTLLVCLASGVLLRVSDDTHTPSAFSYAALSTSAFAGTFWSAAVLWLIGRFLLRTKFPYMKAVEVVGLTSVILVLGYTSTTLLILGSGNGLARPALSFLAGSPGTVRAVLEQFDVFHLWCAVVLAIGLARLSGVTFREAGFWVFAYWLITPIGLRLLA
jgi:hypothetical protein